MSPASLTSPTPRTCGDLVIVSFVEGVGSGMSGEGNVGTASQTVGNMLFQTRSERMGDLTFAR